MTQRQSNNNSHQIPPFFVLGHLIGAIERDCTTELRQVPALNFRDSRHFRDARHRSVYRSLLVARLRCDPQQYRANTTSPTDGRPAAYQYAPASRPCLFAPGERETKSSFVVSVGAVPCVNHRRSRFRALSKPPVRLDGLPTIWSATSFPTLRARFGRTKRPSMSPSSRTAPCARPNDTWRATVNGLAMHLRPSSRKFSSVMECGTRGS